ncbi:MAG: YbjN domain-containing protein [Lachnospiraceae bacterium]|nr:YbjN domain-containing protein [Lachnospiraceae bacterium]
MGFAKDYCDVLDEIGLNHSDVMESKDLEMVYFSIDTKNVKSVRVETIFAGNSVSVVCREICKIPDEKFGDALFICNKINDKYRFSKCVVDGDNELAIHADAFLDEHSGGEETWALVKTTLDKVDETYGLLMKAIWS